MSQRYWYGAAPPLGVAVQVIVVFRGCGATRFDVRLTADTVGDAPVMAKPIEYERSAALELLPALRTQTATAEALLAVAGVQAKVLLVDQLVAKTHEVPS